jgi:anion-transporting  ArsA/GET3 family ATPase
MLSTDQTVGGGPWYTADNKQTVLCCTHIELTQPSQGSFLSILSHYITNIDIVSLNLRQFTNENIYLENYDDEQQKFDKRII